MKTTKPRVFVTQEVPSVDYTPAIDYGDLVFVTSNGDRLSPHPQSLNNTVIMEQIGRKLADFTHDDYLVCTGAPAQMAIVAARLGDRLKKLLVWDNREMKYFEVKLT